MEKHKVLIIGSGASGLMAAKILKQNDVDFLILESTDQVGGRAKTLKGKPHIEYGPEFLHGDTPLSNSLLNEYKLPYYDLKFDYHLFKDGQLRPLPDFWDRVCSVLADIDVNQRDLSFQDYLSKIDKHQKLDQEISKTFIEGFDAADLNLVSTKSLGQMKEVACDPSVRKMRRPLNGYGELMEKMAEEIFPHILFNYDVQEIQWKKNSVHIKGINARTGLDFIFEAEKVVDTVSVGVLKEKQKILPAPRELTSFLRKVEMGQVVKFIAELDPDFFKVFPDETFPFVSSPDLEFSAWWTTTPIHTNTVTGWAGGEKARKLNQLSEDERIGIFLKDLTQISGTTPQKLKAWIRNIHYHNWSEDTSYLGAYSYPRLSDEPSTKVTTSFEETLYFAGEAFHEESSGTIEGALLTGKMAAEQISKSGGKNVAA